MKILAIINLETNGEQDGGQDQLVINNHERVRLAREHSNRFSARDRAGTFFAKLYDPDLLLYDQLEPQARERIEGLEARGVQVCYLATRPHVLQEITEQWLLAHHILRPCVFKHDGTGKIGSDGKPDVGDRFVKHSVWKGQQIPGIIAEVETALGQTLDWILFVDADEAGRREAVEVGDQRILVRRSLQDAVTHDVQRLETDPSASPFLRRLQELASLLEMRETFESAAQCHLRITVPELPGQIQRHTSILLEAGISLPGLEAGISLPGTEQGQRLYRYNELYPQRNELSEVEMIVSLQVTCDQIGHVTSVKMAKAGPALSLLSDLEEVFDPGEAERMQHYADMWIAQAINEFGYVAAARLQRGIQITGQLALDRYMEYLQAKSEEIRAALAGHHDDQSLTDEERRAQPPALQRHTERVEIRRGDQEQSVEKKRSTLFERNATGVIVPRPNAQIRIYLGEKDVWRTYGRRRQKIGTEKIYELCRLLKFWPDWDPRMKLRGRVWVRPTEKHLEAYAGKPGIAYDEGWMELRETEIHPEDRENLLIHCARKLEGGALILQEIHSSEEYTDQPFKRSGSSFASSALDEGDRCT